MNPKRSQPPALRSSAAEYLTFITATGEGGFEKYRIGQDRMYESNFDRHCKSRQILGIEPADAAEPLDSGEYGTAGAGNG